MKRFALAVAASLSGADAAWMSSQTSAIKPSLSNRAAASPIIRMSGGNAAEADVINALEAELATTRAEAWAARCEARDLKSALEAAKAQIRQLQLQSQPEAADDTDRLKESDADSKLTSTDAALFDAIDDNGDGVLTREEFTKVRRDAHSSSPLLARPSHHPCVSIPVQVRCIPLIICNPF